VAHRYASRGDLSGAVRKAAGWLGAGNRDELFEAMMSLWPAPDRLIKASVDQPSATRVRPSFDNLLEPMLWRDTTSYLPGDILYKVDRAAMANSLETRAPFLDPEVAAFAWRAPPDMKLRDGTAKWLPRQLLARYLPPALTAQPKLGFSPPIQTWLKGGLREWAADLLDPAVIRRQGLLEPDLVGRAWSGLLAGDGSQTGRIWAVVMLQAWLSARHA
jgi:asparagine synthase (glutamine-hydrolysing)